MGETEVCTRNHTSFILSWYAVDGILFGINGLFSLDRDSLCHSPMGKRMVASDPRMRPCLHMWDGGSEGSIIPFRRWQGATVGAALKPLFRFYAVILSGRTGGSGNHWSHSSTATPSCPSAIPSTLIGGVSLGRGGPVRTVVRRGKMLPFLCIPLALVVPTDPMLQWFPVSSSEL